MTRQKTLARIAGGLYLLLAILGGWAQLVVRASVFVPGDAAATAANIADNEGLFRWSIAADVAMALVFVLLGLALCRLLWAESARWATATLVFVSVAAGGILMNLTVQIGALVVATDPAYSALGDSLALLLLDLHHYGYLLGGIFFGLWLLPIGIVALRSPIFHRPLGVIVVAGSIAWLFDPVLALTLPDDLTIVRDIVSAPTIVAEFGLIAYLLVIGVRSPRPASIA